MIITVADQDKNLCRYARYAEIPSCAPGWQTFKYGKLGELTENIRTFALPYESKTYTFKMQYEYDSWNRIQTMTYPDGEVVHYDYNRGGMLKKVYGTVKGDFLPQYPSTPHDSLVPLNLHGLGGQASLNSLPPVGDPVPLYDTHTYPYIDSIAYNEFELKSDVFYGNGTHALYAYDSLLRLLLLQSQTRTGDIMQDIVYTYDSVGNITGIANSAGMLPNGLGGTYNSAYTYDDLYRLTSSMGGWQGSQNISYRTTTLYRGNGRIKQKNLAARKLLNGVSDTVNYSHYYHYGNTSQPNTLTRYSSSVWNPGSWLVISNEEDSQFGWDAAGNMTESCIGGDRNCRSLCWDEQNRLQGVKDNKWLSYYQYDAAGDRTYKLTGKGELQNINGEWRYFYHLDNATLYVSPYLVATKQGYTKHYYAETERIASRIGGGRLRYLDQPVVGQGKIVEKQSTNKTYAKEVLEECLDAIHSEGQADLHHLYDMINSAHSETDCYWYHPDHLGSSSWITDSAGTAVQHLHYLPWGEDFVNQRTGSFSSMYTFSAKEKDTETGYSYFGARYYSSDLSIWLSVDPMSDKYPSLSPYVYCADNPVRLVDPNGEEVSEHIDKYGNIIASFDDNDNSVYLHKDGTTKAEIEAQQKRLNNTGGNGIKVGELGGNIDQSSFFGNKLEMSAQYARKMKEMGIVDRYISYFKKVKPTGDWDLKSNTKTIWGVAWQYDDKKKDGTHTTFSCDYFSGATAADVGNFHAGYMGEIAGFSKYMLWKGAGGAETYKAFDNGHIAEGLWRLNGFISPLNIKSGDRWRDFRFNTKGMNAAKRTIQ